MIYSDVQVNGFFIDFLSSICYGKSGSGVSTIIVFLLISPFKSIDICFAYLSALLDTYIFIASSKLIIEHYMMTFFVFRDSFDLVYFI